MALAVTHIILTIALLDIFRHYVFGLKKFPRYLLVVGGIAGLAPDLDVPLGWVLSLLTGTSVNIHGLFTHSLFFAVLFVIIGAVLQYYKNLKWARIFYVIAVGWTFHIFLDCLYGADYGLGSLKLFLWPLQILPTFCPSWNLYPYAHSTEAIILVLWLVHEEIHQKIKCYF